MSFPVLLSLALVLGLELSSRTNLESLALSLALGVKSLALALALMVKSLALALALRVSPLSLGRQVLGQLVFSQSGLLLRPHRARMSDSLLETLVFLKCNSD